MRISDWSSDVCSSDLLKPPSDPPMLLEPVDVRVGIAEPFLQHVSAMFAEPWRTAADFGRRAPHFECGRLKGHCSRDWMRHVDDLSAVQNRSEERREGNECVSTCSSRWATNH